MPVQPDRRVRHRAVKNNSEVTLFRTFTQQKCLSIPPRPRDRQSSGMRIQLGIERPINRPVVRQAELSPLRVIKTIVLRPVCVSFMETPVLVETDPAFSGNSNRCGVLVGRWDSGGEHESQNCDNSQTPYHCSNHDFSWWLYEWVVCYESRLQIASYLSRVCELSTNDFQRPKCDKLLPVS